MRRLFRVAELWMWSKLLQEWLTIGVTILTGAAAYYVIVYVAHVFKLR